MKTKFTKLNLGCVTSAKFQLQQSTYVIYEDNNYFIHKKVVTSKQVYLI